jgi:probable F420-dependent oxidoreductase
MMMCIRPSYPHRHAGNDTIPSCLGWGDLIAKQPRSAVSDVRIAVQIHPQHADYADIRRAVMQAEELGVDIVYNWDHFYPLYGDADGKHFECWTMLGAWAEQTERIEFGALVTCNSYRNPDLLADMARTVDHISNGRLILGIGSGWFERDYVEYGYDFGPTPGWRLDNLAEALPRLVSRWDKLNPAPTRDIPILIGGGGRRKTLKMTAQYASIWHHFGTPDDMKEKSDGLDDWCSELGRNPADIERSVGIDWDKVDDPVATAEAYYAVGMRQFTFGVNGPDYDLGILRPWLAWRDGKRG